MHVLRIIHIISISKLQPIFHAVSHTKDYVHIISFTLKAQEQYHIATDLSCIM
jgi:hypothetical protein